MLEDSIDSAPRHVAFSAETKSHKEYEDVQLHELPQGNSPQDGMVENSHKKAECRFNLWRELVIWLSKLFYVCDLCLDYWICVRHFERNKPRRAWFIFFCILLPNLYAGYKSLQWLIIAHCVELSHESLCFFIYIICYIIAQLDMRVGKGGGGEAEKIINNRITPWRRSLEVTAGYIKKVYMASEPPWVFLLVLFIIFQVDCPSFLLTLYLMQLPTPFLGSDFSVLIGVVVTKLACTMTLGVVHYISVNKMAYHAALSNSQRISKQNSWQLLDDRWEKKGLLSRYAEVCVYCWQLLCIGSRLLAYAMFSVVYFQWLWLLVTLRWCIHTLWIYFDVKEMSLANSIAFGGVYLFTFVTTSPGQQILRVLLYYFITFAEDIIIVILWSTGAPHNPFKQTAIGVMLGCAFGGVIFLSMYYGIFHPERKSTWLRQWLEERQEERQRRSGEKTVSSYGQVSEA
ncbi:unnamed protein product, partial [Meganyctiphanes norvegica]